MSRFDDCLAITLAHEGGWADHPADPGGATMRGVTFAVYRRFKGRDVTKGELRNISDDDLRAIYRSGYWDPMRCDDLPPGVDLVAFDAAVNSGPGQSAKWLQRAAGVTDDGKIGPQSIAAIRTAQPELIINAACNKRMAMLRGLSTWAHFGRGWQRRVDDIRGKALAMIADVPAPAPPLPKRGFMGILDRLFGSI